MKDPERISVVKSAGVLALLGWFWFLGALVTFALGWTAPPESRMLPLVAVMVAGIGLLGLVLALTRLGVDIDRRQRSASRWFGPLIPLFARTEPLERFDHVLLSKILRRERSGLNEYYVVQLAGPHVSPLVVERSRDAVAARIRTEEVARLLTFAVQDQTGPAPLTRPPGSLDDSLRTQLRRGGARPARIERPAGARTVVAQSGAELHLAVPPAGFRWLHLAILSLIVVVTVAAAAVAVAVADPANVLTAVGVVLLTGTLNFLVPFLVFAAQARARDEVWATPARLRVRHRGLAGSRTVEMPADDVEELEIELGTHARLAARGDRAAIHFGKGLSAAELAWLRSQLYEILAGA
jgi:hypothetical protein